MAEGKTNIHKDHRKKVRERYYENGLQGMAPHNIIELLLFFGIPFKDTNPMAHELINRFGSLSSVLEAKRSDLLQIKGMTENAACLISLILPLYRKYSEDLMNRKKNFKDNDELVEFLRALHIDNNINERVFVLCFDANDYLITYRMLGEGDINSSNVDLRKLAALVLETNCQSCVISHNHPHGVCLPSKADVGATNAISYLLSTLKVKLSNHIIVSDNDYFSMAESKKFCHLFLSKKSDFESD